MSDQDTAANNGNAATFDIDAITDLIVPFEFEFRGSKLRGRWFMYKTTTPEWATNLRRRFNEHVERFIDVTAEMKTTHDTVLLKKLNKEKARLEDEAQRAQYEWLADAIVEWNAVHKDGSPIPIETLRLATFPTPLLVALGKHLEKDRSGENPTSSDSQSGS